MGGSLTSYIEVKHPLAFGTKAYPNSQASDNPAVGASQGLAYAHLLSTRQTRQSTHLWSLHSLKGASKT